MSYSDLLDPHFKSIKELDDLPDEYKIKLLGFMLKFANKNCLEYELIQILLKKIESLENQLEKSKKEANS
jgi:hypothetical protein